MIYTCYRAFIMFMNSMFKFSSDIWYVKNIVLSILVLLICLFLFFFNLNLELLTQFPGSNDEKY